MYKEVQEYVHGNPIAMAVFYITVYIVPPFLLYKAYEAGLISDALSIAFAFLNNHLTSVLTALSAVLALALYSSYRMYRMVKGYDPLEMGLHRLSVWDRLNVIKSYERLHYYRKIFSELYPDFDPTWIFDNKRTLKEDGFSERGTINYEYERLKIAMIANKIGDSLFRKLSVNEFVVRTIATIVFTILGLLIAFYMSFLPEDMHVHPSGLLIAMMLCYSVYNTFYVYSAGKLPVLYGYFLPKTLIDREQIDEIDAHLHDTLYEQIPEGCPADLADRRRIGIVDKNGVVVDGQILPSDISKPVLYADIKQFTSRVSKVLNRAFITSAVLVYVFMSLMGVQ